MKKNTWRRSQCEWGLKTANNGGTSIQVTVLEIIITVLQCLPTDGVLACVVCVLV